MKTVMRGRRRLDFKVRMMSARLFRATSSERGCRGEWQLIITLFIFAVSGCTGVTASKSQTSTPPTGTPLTVSITVPASGATVSGTVTMNAAASGTAPVANVQYQVDGASLGAAVTAAPYSQSLNTTTLSNGKHNLTATAVDNSGNKATSAVVSITTNNVSATPPTVSIISPASGATVSGTITVTASASASDPIIGVQFLLDGADMGSKVTASPYSVSWNTTTLGDGLHNLVAVATDSSQNSASASRFVTVANHSVPAVPSLDPTPGWHKIPGTTLLGGNENVTSCPANTFNGYSYNFLQNCFNIIADPNTAIVDPPRYRMILFGGGHSDYFGNEVYSLELNLVGRTSIGPTVSGPLIRLDPPAPPQSGATTTETLAAGSAPLNIPSTPSPSSRHTYGGPTYVPLLDQFFMVGGALPPTGFSSSQSWFFQLGNLTASCAPNCDPHWINPGITYPNGTVSMNAEYDPGTKLIWVASPAGSGDLSSLDPTNYAAGWTHRASIATDYHIASVLDPDDEYFILVNTTDPTRCAAGCGIFYYNLTGTVAGQHPTVDASCTSMLANSIPYPRVGMAWDPIGKRVVLYPSYGNVVWFIDPKTWTCTNETYGSVQGTDYPQDSVGIHEVGADVATLHKFGYFPNLDTFVLCNDPNNDCWYLNLQRNVTARNTTSGTLTNQLVSVAHTFRGGDVLTDAGDCSDAVHVAATRQKQRIVGPGAR